MKHWGQEITVGIPETFYQQSINIVKIVTLQNLSALNCNTIQSRMQLYEPSLLIATFNHNKSHASDKGVLLYQNYLDHCCSNTW